MMKKIACFAITIVFALTLVFGYFLTKLTFDYDFENFFPVGDQDLAYYLKFRKQFENDNDYLLLAFENDSSVFDSTFLKRIDNFVQTIKKEQNVRDILSLTTLKEPIISQAGSLRLRILHAEDPSRYKQDSIKIFQKKYYVENLIAANGKALGIIVKHTQNIKKKPADSLRAAIFGAIKKNKLAPFHVAGKIQAQPVYIEKMKFELVVFVALSIFLTTLVLVTTYRSFKNTIIPLIIVLLTVIWTVGLMGMLGKKLDILLILLPSILFVVGMSDVVHILTKYIEELRKGLKKTTAIKIVLKEIGLATLLTSITTAVGFLTLLTSTVRPIKEFGLYIAIGVLFAFILAFTLLPAILIFTNTPPLVHKKHIQDRWRFVLRHAFCFVIRNKSAIIFGNIALLCIAGIGISQIQKNSFLIDDIPKNDPLSKDFTYFDENFGGSRPFEVAIKVKSVDQDIFSPKLMALQDKLHQFLEDSCEVKLTSSPVLLIKQLNQSLNGGFVDYFKLPQSEKEWKIVKSKIRYVKRANETLKLFTEDKKLGRFSGRSADAGSIVSEHRREKIKAYIKQNIPSNTLEIIFTGTSLLIEKNNTYITKTMLEGLGIAFGIIALIAALLFKSFKMSMLTLIPNIIPLILLAGVMGIFGISLKLSTSIVFTIAFGIAVDDTIHFISKLRLELGKGHSVFRSVKNTFLSTGKAIIITTCILLGGFLLLMFSSFGGTFYTGLLVSLTLFFALIIDLTLLPVLVLKYYHPKSKK